MNSSSTTSSKIICPLEQRLQKKPKIEQIENYDQNVKFFTNEELESGFIFDRDYKFGVSIEHILEPFTLINQRECNINNVNKIYELLQSGSNACNITTCIETYHHSK